MAELLYDQDAPRLGIDHLLPHPVEGPARSLAIGLALEMDDRRQHADQHLRLRPGELEMAAEHRHPAAVVQLDQRAFAGRRESGAIQSSGGKAGSLATRNGEPWGNRRQSPRWKSTGFAPSPLHRSQQAPEVTA